MTNKKEGSDYEKYIAEKSYKLGFFAHLLQGNKSGQPFDLILARNNKCYFADCKVCHSKRFPLKRIEPNQKSAFDLLAKVGCNKMFIICGFDFDGIVKGSGEKYRNMYLPYSYIKKQIEKGESSIPFDAWLELDNMYGNIIIGDCVK